MTPDINASLLQLNTLALESTAAALVRAESESTIADALAWARARELAVIPLGEGSNIVLAGDLDAMVLQVATRGIEEVARSAEQVTLNVAAGEPWHAFVEWTLSQGFFGLENLALIPGTVGAAPIQNIGAYGVELSEFVQRVRCLHIEEGDSLTLKNAECAFGYRDSVFKHALRDKVVVTSVELALPLQPEVNTSYPALAAALAEPPSDDAASDSATPVQVFDAVVALRRSKLPDPAVEPNAGSFFKNPVLSAAQYQQLRMQHEPPAYPQPNGEFKIPAAWLIEHCGWKGKRRQEQGVHPEHALVLVNYGNPSGEALLGMAADIQQGVKDTFGVVLEIEPRVYGQTA